MSDLETRLERALKVGDRLDAKRGGPSMRRHQSKQDYATPIEFIAAVETKFGELAMDLAASSQNKKAQVWFDEEGDSLLESWGDFGGNLWLNPPFGNIEPWAKKCAEEATRLSASSRILLLVPASVGSNWFANHVHGKALVLALQGRLTFEGCSTPFPRDLILAVYGVGLKGFEVWDWRKP